MALAKARRAASYGIDQSEIREIGDKEADYELLSPDQLYGSHVNAIPAGSAVHAPRLFYGARFFNQAMPILNAEAPLVQSQIQGEDGSFDDHLGKFAGAAKADEDGVVEEMDDNGISFRGASGKLHHVPLWKNLIFNRKTGYTRTPLVKPGDQVTKGGMLAKSNYTDDKGTLALGLNARVGLVPYKGWSMDDAIVISESFAQRLKSEHTDTYSQDFDQDVKGGKDHYVSLFPHKFTSEQMENLSPEGVVKPGTIVKPGDPLFLATRPKAISSQASALGKLSRIARQTRNDAAQVWDADEDGEVVDIGKTKTGYKVVVQSFRPTKEGDKITQRAGSKGIVSKILSDDRMPRTTDGKPLEIVMNQLGIPSRVNSALLFEIALGKVAAKLGKPIKLPNYTGEDADWGGIVRKAMADAGVTDKEEVFDPNDNKKLEAPITVGNLYVSKLLHVGESKLSGRGVASYDANEQPSRGSGEGAQSKRVSGLETNSLLAAGAYKNLKETATLRGQRNDDYWRSLRVGINPRPPGSPFVWDKFQALLSGSGMLARKVGDGNMRLGPMTDRELDRRGAVEIRKAELVDPRTLDPVAGGLFDQGLVGANKYGKITLPEALPNPVFENQIMKLLGLTKKEYREILSGRMELPEHLR